MTGLQSAKLSPAMYKYKLQVRVLHLDGRGSDYFYLQDHSTEVLYYDQSMSQRVNLLIIKNNLFNIIV